jgi:uncharacterized SAM-binding protein YcdF (DUF218 family)
MYAIVTQLLEPYTFLLLSLALAILWAWRATSPRHRSLTVAGVLVGLLIVLSTPIMGYLADGSLEWSYPMPTEIPAPNDTIVVLSGDLINEDLEGRYVRLGGTTFARCQYAARLYKQAGGCRIVLSGGQANTSLPSPTLAAAMRDFFVGMGIPRDDLVLEDKSTTTYENALYSKPLLEQAGESRIWLVTGATHMRRAEGCFRTQGISVVPAACDHHALEMETTPGMFIPSSKGISRVGHAAHEWLGLAWYWLRGRI